MKLPSLICLSLASLLFVDEASTFSVLSVQSRPAVCPQRASTWMLYSTADEAAEEPPEPAPEAPKKGNDASDILNSPAFLQRKLEVLKGDIGQAEAALEEAKARVDEGKAEWGPQLDDLQKEYSNIQERMNTQSKAGDSMAVLQIAREMLNMLDNFDRAFAAVTPETDEQRAIESQYKETYQQILDIFQKLGIQEVETVGIEFDYELHQAVMQQPSDEYEEGIVCQELQKGFKMEDGQLVRAAMVVVAM